MQVEVVAGGSPVVESARFGSGGVGQVDDRAEAGDDDGWVLAVVLAEAEQDPLPGGGVGDDDLPHHVSECPTSAR